ncbi:uncharacterized protein H6S33_012269 [Morchella sextelata]|uniref:uncharacterized protein n=1 Tax=Morchella sextelata TaxID=1174677 RepID=UPI001D041B7C|nr:uncharacterized protein H6S33_012269 [Morchella sextelata]KAH0609723.1 hypothetical protein H6S33_012269 [Morchella sextelata]
MRRRKGTHPEEAGNNDQREVDIKFDSSAANAPGPKNPQEQATSEASRLSTSPTVKRTSLWQYMIPFSPRLFGASIFAARIPFVRAADAGDEFTNNFVTDLAPLLALFGERVATQFMSEAFTIADSIIFAVAPLGVMTAMVGAIRVGGPNELRAIIGRAKESRSTVELESLEYKYSGSFSPFSPVLSILHQKEKIKFLSVAEPLKIIE